MATKLLSYHKAKKAKGQRFTRGVSMNAQEEAELVKIGLTETGYASVSVAVRFLLTRYRRQNGEPE